MGWHGEGFLALGHVYQGVIRIRIRSLLGKKFIMTWILGQVGKDSHFVVRNTVGG